MKTLKYKHLTLEDRLTIQEYLNANYNFTQIAKSIGKNRRTISKEVYKHRIYRTKSASDLSECKGLLSLLMFATGANINLYVEKLNILTMLFLLIMNIYLHLLIQELIYELLKIKSLMSMIFLALL